MFTPHYIGKDIYIFLAENDHGLNNHWVITAIGNKNLWLSNWNQNVYDKYQHFKLIDNNDGFFKIQNVGSGLFIEARYNSNQKYLILTNEKFNCIAQLFYFYSNKI